MDPSAGADVLLKIACRTPSNPCPRPIQIVSDNHLKIAGPLLALETSGLRGSVALATPDPQSGALRIESMTLPSDARSAQSLAPSIDRLLKMSGVAPQELGCVSVTVGPGSFTGLRVGVTTAKTLAYATGASVVAVHTLAALAEPYLGDSFTGSVWAVLDAQRGEAFTAEVHDAYASDIETLRVEQASFAGTLEDGAMLVGPIAERLTGAGALNLKVHTTEPTAEAVARIGAVHWTAGRTCDLFQLVPDYCRPSAAEENADARERSS